MRRSTAAWSISAIKSAPTSPPKIVPFLQPGWLRRKRGGKRVELKPDTEVGLAGVDPGGGDHASKCR
jgi:hypothetical protein